MRTLTVALAVAFLCAVPLRSIATTILVKNLPDDGATVTIEGVVDHVLSDTWVGECQFNFRDTSGAVVVVAGNFSPHPCWMGFQPTKVRITGMVKQSWFGLGNKYIEVERITHLP